MLSLEDATALSAWYRAPRLQIQDFLRRQPDRVPLEAVLDAVVRETPPPGFADILRDRAGQLLAAARRANIDALPWGHSDYPPLLAAIPDAPFVLWLKGPPSCLAKPAVAVVGSRAATPYGLEAASRLAGDLAAAGVLVVSGLARGVDSAAHRAALAAGGETVAVLGSGVDIIYPPEHLRLAAEVMSHGAVVSEFPPGTMPVAFHFPARNRIISGLSQAVVVVEAAERSGSLITADFALQQGREVMAVPGSVLSGRYRGCHALIRDGAAVAESAEDVLAELRASFLARAVRSPHPSEQGLVHDPIVAAMAPGESYDVEALGDETGLSPDRLLPRLLELELRGAVRRVDGGRFVRVGRTC
jgi:DNA processing protein